MEFITPELLEKDNQYFCDICNQKVDALKGVKLLQLPPILTLSINRFTFDYETL